MTRLVMLRFKEAVTTSGKVARGTRACRVGLQRMVAVGLVVGLAVMWGGAARGQSQPVGPSVADFLLRAGGELDGSGNGAGARRLATEPGYTITTAPGCFPPVATDMWCGRLVLTAPVLLAAFRWHLDNQVLVNPPSNPPSGGTTDWYNDGNARVYVQDAGNNFDVGGGNVRGCVFPEQTGGGWNYLVNVIQGDAQHQWWWPNGQSGGCGPCPTTKTPEIVTGCIRLGSSNSTAWNPWDVTQENANKWVQDRIDGGHWADVVKPALDGAIRAAVTWQDLKNMGIDREQKVIAVDPGHGRNCPKQTWQGATGPKGLREAEVVFDIAQRVKTNLEARGYTVIQTRLDECNIAPATRLARSVGATIFVSVHLNAHKDPTFNWTEVWVDAEVTSTRAQSESLAGLVARDQAPLLINPNPVILRMSTWSGRSGIPGVVYSGHDDPWNPKKIDVLEHASDNGPMPAALSEVAHLSNEAQEAAFRDSANIQQVAAAISGAITQYFGPP